MKNDEKTLEFHLDVDGKLTIIKTHYSPHLDELAAILLIERYADDAFVNTYGENGIISVGIGHGPLDEHQADGKRKKGECAATLTAKALKVNNLPELAFFLDYVLERDTNAGAHHFELDALVKMLVRQNPASFDSILDIIRKIMDAVGMEQEAFLGTTYKEFQEDAQIYEVAGPRDAIKVAMVESDNPQINKYARWKNGGGCDAVIQYQTEKGHVQIFASKTAGIDLTDVAQILRYEEQAAAGKILIRDWESLRSRGGASTIIDGEITRLNNWYLVGPEVLLNGSISAPDVQATKLSLEDILKFVTIGINPEAFEVSRKNQCLRDQFCSASKKNPCPWHAWGLPRCRKVRAMMHS